jgi:hypothetical protein
MTQEKKQPEYKDLQEILNSLRERIAAKREEAIRLFTELLQELEQGKELPENLKKQIEAIKAVLKIGKKEEKTDEKQAVAELTTEDILKALQSLIMASDNKAKISTKLLHEELQAVISMRLFEQSGGKSNNIATASDYINLLNSKSFKVMADNMGGAEKLLSESMKLANTTCHINISDIKERMGNAGLPGKMESRTMELGN